MATKTIHNNADGTASTQEIQGGLVVDSLHLNTDAKFLSEDDFGSGAGKVTEGNDPRLSDARDPLSHTHTPSEVGLGNVDNTSDVNKPVSTLQAAADTATLNAAKSYADGLSLGARRLRGNFDASGANAYPSTGGSGAAGAVQAGDQWEISVAGNGFDVGDSVYALVNSPGQTAANWGTTEHNTVQATESERGTAKIATQATIEDNTTTNDTNIVTPKKVWLALAKFLTLAWTWTGKQTFQLAPRFSSVTASQVLVVDAAKDLSSEVKGSAFNKNFGTNAGTVLEGDNYISPGSTNQYFAWDKTFKTPTVFQIPTFFLNNFWFGTIGNMSNSIPIDLLPARQYVRFTSSSSGTKTATADYSNYLPTRFVSFPASSLTVDVRASIATSSFTAEFYNSAGTQVGSSVDITPGALNVWETKTITVPGTWNAGDIFVCRFKAITTNNGTIDLSRMNCSFNSKL